MRKLSVIIVDDEMIARKGIRDCLDWEMYGFEIKGLFDTSLQALEYLKTEKIDIVITDIRMPMMDGLELVRESREAKVESHFIILSGYDQFAYAQKAIRYGVEGYLLKPIKEEELLEILETIKKKYFKDDAFEAKTNLILNRQKYSKTVRELVDYVDRNLDQEELSLKYMADNVLFMNSGYLSKLFVKETGYKFSTFLMIKRMERALQLFRNQEGITVYEVAEQSGFGKNPQYFSTVFKKYYGMPPSDYMEIQD